MKIYLHTLLIAILMGGFCVSCAEDDDFSSDATLRLDFSQDTISFDTVFTEVGSSINKFKIFNRNDKSLNIESIELMNPKESGFSLNIDGYSGTGIKDVAILRKDSLYGFVRVTVNPHEENAAVLIRDSIRFVTNGNIQYIILEAIGRNVIRISDYIVDKDITFGAKVPYLVYGELKVKENATLTITPGAELYFHDKASMRIAGQLIAEGTTDARIVMRGDRLDKMNGVIPYSNIPGQWGGVVFEESSKDNKLSNLVVRNAITGIEFKSSDMRQLKARLNGVTVQNSSEYGLLVSGGNIEAVNCLFSNARKSVVSLSGGGVYSFLHCTLANYYEWSMREGAALTIGGDGEGTSLDKYQFDNTIIFGSMQNELNIHDFEQLKAKISFRNCLIRSKQEFASSSFVETIWNKEPVFLSINQSGLYDFDFMLTEKSAARDIADASLSSFSPVDMNGVPRLADSGPDIGCFEFLSK